MTNNPLRECERPTAEWLLEAFNGIEPEKRILLATIDEPQVVPIKDITIIGSGDDPASVSWEGDVMSVVNAYMDDEGVVLSVAPSEAEGGRSDSVSYFHKTSSDSVS